MKGQTVMQLHQKQRTVKFQGSTEIAWFAETAKGLPKVRLGPELNGKIDSNRQ
jgi:hypothetical protein